MTSNWLHLTQFQSVRNAQWRLWRVPWAKRVSQLWALDDAYVVKWRQSGYNFKQTGWWCRLSRWLNGRASAAFAGVPGAIPGWGFCDFFHFCRSFTSNFPFSFPLSLSPFPSSSYPVLFPFPSSSFPFPSPSDLSFALKNAFFAFIPFTQFRLTIFCIFVCLKGFYWPKARRKRCTEVWSDISVYYTINRAEIRIVYQRQLLLISALLMV